MIAMGVISFIMNGRMKMKRSEIVKLINTILKSGYDYPAETILQKLEDEGMYLTEVAKFDGFDLRTIVYWEPEDADN